MDNPLVRAGLYAIIDLLAEDVVGIIQQHRHEATAVRFFSDVASQEGTVVAKHVNDHALVRLGYISEALTLIPDYAVVITGATWAAARAASQQLELQA